MIRRTEKKARYGLFSNKSLEEAERKTGGPFSHFGEYSLFDEGPISSGWVQIKPSKPVMLNAIVCDDYERTKLALIEGADVHQSRTFEVDAYTGLMAEGSELVRGKAVVAESGAAKRVLPIWHRGEGVYLLNNLSQVIHAPDHLREFLRSLYAMRTAEMASAEELVDAIDLGKVSLCSLMSTDDWDVLCGAHNRSRFPFHLIKKVQMEI